ncbi:adenosylmethionine--8-amino-7-oxononanoate aminotransferase BioA [Aliidongia dinghuensis]|uniref:Adenosylmethionine-8-amino-7-oxononanoate aminotransferase n=1 Tax=Aliidongia dinghuensis TaxID=1867774 RepID=A0A8J2YVC6_9PROT|nr:adenosylmethionine--8-amino-7-oxononanoate transaminase [Aliidongia dinghuensis]GGF21105.1 adenosylmethionine--8-amino-7-oxononanoate aminotransferase BioA [Aliidongia dinghuensis]
MTRPPGPPTALWRPYTQMKLAAPPPKVQATEGVRLILDDGTSLVDGISSWWTACHGYNHPHIRAAVADQLARMPHVMFGGLTHEPAERLARRLATLLPGDLDHVFFTDSGSVAVEVAMKMAVQYWLNRGVKGRHKFVSFRDGYHGDTLGAMSVTDPDGGMHRHFAGYLPRQFVAELPTDLDRIAGLESLLARHRDEIAGVIVEPLVQGAGGMRFHDGDTLRRIANAAARHGHLLIADEIMTGFGRTGRMFASEEADIVPDIMCLSKALTGGTIALAATVARAHVFDAFWSDEPSAALMHGPTFMANPLACAAANASLDLFEREPWLSQVQAIAAALRRGLEPARDLPGVVDVRVQGAIGVVQLTALKDAGWLRRRFIELGVWARPFGDILYVAPPFVIEPRDLDLLVRAMVTVARDWSERFGVT